MIDVLTREQVAQAEKQTVGSGVDVMLLRMNAALAVVGAVERIADKKSRIAVFCGSGGNGYDGSIAACRLKRSGYDVAVYTVGDVNKFPCDALAYARNEGVSLHAAEKYGGDADIIVDAIFGIGLNKPIVGKTAELIDRLNAENGAFRIAVDIPSGLDANTGEVLGTAFRADATVSFTCYKLGMLFGEGLDRCGRITIENVGVKTDGNIKVYNDGDFKPYRRKPSAHKGTAGRVFIIGGSGGMIGAPLMAGAAAHAAYLNGAGTVTVCLPSVHRAAASARAVMAMMKFLPDTRDGYIRFEKQWLDEIISKAVAIDIGTGMGVAPDLKRTVEYLSENFGGVLVVDADALNAIKGDYAFLKSGKAKVVLTPHVGEFERLTGKPATTENAAALARDIGGIVVLKSATTIVTDGKQIRLNVAGTPAMAKGGMGDVLGGCITALSCAYEPFDAACIACYRNGVGAERAVSSYAETMLTARDVLKFADYDEL